MPKQTGDFEIAARRSDVIPEVTPATKELIESIAGSAFDVIDGEGEDERSIRIRLFSSRRTYDKLPAL
jgi:hypothetical protein